MVAVSLMTLIVLALYGMFRQTQRALRGNVTQADILESGRAALELMVRELQEASAAGFAAQTNFYTELNLSVNQGKALNQAFFKQALVRTNTYHTNVVQDLFFLTHRGKDWTAIGYRVVATNSPVGTLYRFAFTTNAAVLPFNQNNLSLLFRSASHTNRSLFNPVTEGVTHLRIQVCDRAGRPLNLDTIDAFYPASRRLATDELGRKTRLLWLSPATNARPDVVIRQLQDERGRYYAEESRYLSNALPAFVDLELGVLEAPAFEQYRALQVNPQLATNFLGRQAAKVHLFRQRVPIPAAAL
jgi:hypothetical protein